MPTDNNIQSARILIVDDTPSNIDVLKDILRDDYTVIAATNGEKALKISQGITQPDLILLDIKMAGIDGFETCQRLKANDRTRQIPIIFITADLYVESEERGFSLGAVDYITKPFNPTLVKVRIQNQLYLKQHRDNLETLVNERTKELHKEHEKSLKSEHLYRSLMESSPDAIILINDQGVIELVNDMSLKMMKYQLEDIVGKNVEFLFPKRFHEKDFDLHHQVMNDQSILKIIKTNRLTIKRKDGSEFPVDIRLSPINLEDGIMLIANIRDMTDREHLLHQLHQARKMDALGKLTGGIAHDFNNILGVILGYAELLEHKLSDQTKLSHYAHEIQRSGQRGAKLTKKLLSFSRKNVSEAEVLNINSLLLEQQNMLEKILTVQIKLIFDLDKDLWQTNLDSAEFEDVILNMSINAMHAINVQGQLKIQTHNESINDNEARILQVEPGDYILLNITDSGCGMDEIILDKIFEPFYSTKGEKGTGLGLSQVYGFVERCGGTIKVKSELGQGTCFTLYFPRSHEIDSDTQLAAVNITRNYRGSETILVVDDEQSMIDLAYVILTDKGYHVLSANDGSQALELLERNTVDLVITDVIMPEMNGFQLASQANKLYPNIKIQMISGYTDTINMNISDSRLFESMLYKPYTSSALLTQIRNVLDDGRPSNILAGRNILVMDDEENMQVLFKLHLEKLGCKITLASNSNEAINFYLQSMKNENPFDITILDLIIPGGDGGNQVAEKIREINPLAKLIVSSGYSEGEVMTRYCEFGYDGAIEKNFDRNEIKRVLEHVISLD